jgi:hypothetical protein
VYACNDHHRLVLYPKRSGERGEPIACPLCGAVVGLLRVQLVFSELGVLVEGSDRLGSQELREHVYHGYDVAGEAVRWCSSSASR